MKTLSYMKIDFRTIGKQKYLILFYPFFYFILFRNTGLISFISLFTLPTFINLPFLLTDQCSCHKLNFTLPANIKSIVAGRFLYFLIVVLYSTTVTYAGFYFFKTWELEIPNAEFLYLLGVCVICMIVSIQYIIFYKVNVIHKSLVSMITTLPAIIVSLFITYLGDKKFEFATFYTYITNHSAVLLLGMFLLTLIALSLSYMICTHICKTKDF